MLTFERKMHWFDYITINNYWFAIAVRSQVMTPLIIPLLIQQFVGEESKGTYYGGLRLWGLMIALLTQSVMGVISDHYSGRWGRRRVFILFGTMGEFLALGCMVLILNYHAVEGFWWLFIIYFLSMVSMNTAQAAVNGLIPDIVPDNYKSKFSSVKTLLDLPLSLIFFSLVITRIIASGNILGAIVVLAIINGVCLLLTMLVPEKPFTAFEKINWEPILRLILMVVIFTVVIITIGWLIQLSIRFIPNDHTITSYFLVGLISVAGISLAILLSVTSGIYISLGKGALQNRDFGFWVFNRLAFLTGTTNVGGFLVYFLQSKFTQLKGIQAAAPVSGLIIITGICILLATLPSGNLCDHFGKKRIMVVSAIFTALGVFVLVSMNTLELMTIGGIMLGIGTGLFYTANWSLGTSIVPKDKAGLYLGISNIAGAGAGAIGAYMGGPIGDQFGYSLLMVIYGIIILLSITAFWQPQRFARMGQNSHLTSP